MDTTENARRELLGVINEEPKERAEPERCTVRCGTPQSWGETLRSSDSSPRTWGCGGEVTTWSGACSFSTGRAFTSGSSLTER